MKVLSLFDGMSCGQIALQKLGIKVDVYYASEIEKSSIKVTMKNFPNTIQLGSVTELTEDKLKKLGEIDLLIGGSPCTNLSKCVINNIKHNKGLDGEKSKLFYEYVRILNTVKPKYFLLENVESMKNEDRDIISEVLGVEPIMINSSLFSAQDRKRYYWTNLKVKALPKNKELYLKDIVLSKEDLDDKYWYKQNFFLHEEGKRPAATLNINGHDILKRVYSLDQKCPTLTAVSGGNHQKKVLQDGRCRKLTPLEYERLQTVPDGYTEGVSDTKRWTMLGNGWTVDVIVHILKGLPDTYKNN